ERRRGHNERVDGLERDRGRRAGPAVDGRQLPDEIAGLFDRQEDLAARSRLHRHLDPAAEHGDDVVTGLALAEQPLARPESPRATGGLERAPFVAGEEAVRLSRPRHGASVRTGGLRTLCATAAALPTGVAEPALATAIMNLCPPPTTTSPSSPRCSAG